VVEVRLAYVRALTVRQRYKEAAAQLDIVTRTHAALADPWLSLGALRLEMREGTAAEAALQRYLALVDAPPPAEATPGTAAEAEPGDTADGGDNREGSADDSRAEGQVQAWLMLAQAAEMRGDTAASERWLARIDDPQRALQVQSRRALLLVRQGQVDQARQLIRAVPEKEPGDARAKLQAEVQVLREARRWQEAWQLMGAALQRFGDDIELIYEKAMLAERIERFDDMEALLRRIMTLEPNHYHAHNALGYSLADRNQRLPEARQLIVRALELAPGDPFITDSLGWVEYRLGNREESLRLLRQAYGARPDPEIAAHLGEVLWVSGQRDEARQVWQDAKRRDAANEVLRSTLARLQVDL
jgi:tetratricopeptide (TPR) repeat protein